MNDEFLIQLSRLKEAGTAVVVVTMVKVRGSAPQEIGARIIVAKDGLVFGTVGGGKLEEKAIAHAKSILTQELKYDFSEWNLQTDVGMTCGGVVGLFFEKILPISEWKIAIFGAGHVAQELVRLLLRLDCEITCIDPRLEWLDKLPEHARLKKIHTDDMSSVVKKLSVKTFVASMTMGHAYDLPILIEALGNFNYPYVGVIGSESKALVLRNDLAKNGIDKDKIKKLHCPIGERIGNNHPAEIAVSIVAQLLKVRDSSL